MSDRAVEEVLRLVGLAVWGVIGSPTWTRLRDAAHPVAWLALYFAFAIVFVAATRRDAPRARRRALIACEAVLATVLGLIGMPYFEGALFVIVAAQAPMVFPPRVVLAWDVAQAAMLFSIILPSHGALGAVKATGEYLAFALFALAIFALRNREAAARRELAHAHSMLLGTQALLTDDARARERIRVAREVHDAIGHGLSAASIHLQIATRAHAGDAAIAAASDAVRTTLADIRGLVGTMRDDCAVDLGTALRAMCAGIHEPAIHVAILGPLRVADPTAAHALFRCVQEALTNALRHARANAIWIEVGEDEGGVTARVRDDGVGADQLAFGNGLEGLRARLAELEGTLEITTAVGHGVEVRAWVPR